MASVKNAMKAKSDQLNFVDIGESELIIEITAVDVRVGDQPVSIFYDGCDNRPFKPSKGVIRILDAAWGDESYDWIGKSIKLYGDKTVRWAGEAVGGLRVRALSDIPEKGIDVFVAESKAKRRKQHFNLLKVELSDTDKQWIEAIKADATVIDQLEEGDYKDKIVRLAGV